MWIKDLSPASLVVSYGRATGTVAPIKYVYDGDKIDEPVGIIEVADDNVLLLLRWIGFCGCINR